MRNEINLLSKVQQTKKRIRKLFVVSIVVSGLTFLTAIVILAYSFILNSDLSGVNTRISDLQGKITSLSKQKETALRIRERLSNIQKILLTRKNLSIKANDILGIFPPNIIVDEFKVTQDLVSIRVESPSLSDVDSIMVNQIGDSSRMGKLGLRKVDLTAFSSDKSNYVAAFDFYYTLKK